MPRKKWQTFPKELLSPIPLSRLSLYAMFHWQDFDCKHQKCPMTNIHQKTKGEREEEVNERILAVVCGLKGRVEQLSFRKGRTWSEFWEFSRSSWTFFSRALPLTSLCSRSPPTCFLFSSNFRFLRKSPVWVRWPPALAEKQSYNVLRKAENPSEEGSCFLQQHFPHS